MRKVILVGMIISAPFFALSKPSLFVSSNTFNFFREDLVNQLAKDKDFQGFCNELFLLSNRIKKNDCRSELNKVAVGTATENEKNTLSAKMGFNSFEELNNQVRKVYNYKIEFQKKFPQLASVENVKDVIANAIKKAISEKTITSIVKGENCESYLAAQLAICALWYLNDPDSYYWCVYWALFEYDICLLT